MVFPTSDAAMIFACLAAENAFDVAIGEVVHGTARLLEESKEQHAEDEQDEDDAQAMPRDRVHAEHFKQQIAVSQQCGDRQNDAGGRADLFQQYGVDRGRGVVALLQTLDVIFLHERVGAIALPLAGLRRRPAARTKGRSAT